VRIFLSLILILLTHFSFSQCVTGTPPTLTCGTPITVASNTPSGLYGSASVGNPSCAISGDKITDGDLYAVEYQPGKVITVDMCLTIGNYISILSADGCTELSCTHYGTSFNLDNTACNGNRTTTISMDDLGLTPGTTYYIKVQSVANCGGSPCSSASIAGRSYTIECSTLLANSCSNNQVLSGNISYSICNNGAADNSGNNDSEGGLCGYSIENNLMFKWCTDATNTPVSIDIQNLVIGTGSNVQFAILQGNCGGPYTTIQCNSGIASDQLISIGGTTANTCYWIMFDGNAGTTFCADIMMIDAIPLPVELLYFKGESKGSYNHLNWATASESNSHYYLIERSYDAYVWENVGIEDAAGNTNSITEYYFKDFKVKNSVTYYRLSQYDYDGKYEVFRVIGIDNTKDFINREIEVVYNLLGENITHRHETYEGVKIIIYDDGYVEKQSVVIE
jgi:hypothetical protein